MNTTIFYYTGTGNSLWVSRTIAKELGDTEVISMKAIKESPKDINAKRIGLVFPVYIWGVPAPVRTFITDILTKIAPEYVFAVAVNGGQVANTLIQLKKFLKSLDLTLSAGFDIKTPSNYTPMGGPGPEEKQQKLFEDAKKKISRIAAAVRGKEKVPMEKGPLWQRVIFSGIIYNISYSQVAKMDKQFSVDDKCNKCGTCQRVCPAANITLQDGKPVWNHRCEQCFACLQWCPKEAIQYGPKTAKYERYHHPEVTLTDMFQ
jgi:ferredoxin